jgi:hypothetical protein
MKKFTILLALLILSLNVNAKTASSKETSVTAEKTVSEKEKGFKTAIPVNSVKEEYQYIYSQYPGSQVLSQALVYDENKTPYDILTVKMPDGSKKDFYFDVTEVFKTYIQNY